MMRGIGIAIGVAALGLIVASVASPAPAAHHLVKVREVFPGAAAAPAAEFVELQLPAAGENLVAGQASVDLYNATGAQTSTAPFLSNPPNGQSQRTMLAATAEASGMFGVTADLTLPSVDGLAPAGGAACLDSTTFGPLDCVRWGSSSAASPSPSGAPAASISDGSSLTRSIAPGCATLLETGDDTNDSATDFALTVPTPQNNSATPSETACSGGGGASGGDAEPPNTKIKKGPEGKIETDTATVKFKSTERGSTFACKLDRKRYKRCRSPKRLKNLDRGKHKFAVRATDAAGNTDATPAKLRFRVVEG
ncbi:MAG: hypothetical protein ACRDLO_09945 [Solirubrobacterales bacterium]